MKETIRLLHRCYLILMSLLFCLSPLSMAQDTAPVSCMSVEDVDFGNTTFDSGGSQFSFHGGKAHHWDCQDCSERRNKWDWEARIEKDVTVIPTPDVPVRFLLIHDDHKTGTGWWYHLVGFRCAAIKGDAQKRQLVKVFDRTAMTLHIEKLTDDGVIVSVTEQGGVQRQYRYKWDNQRLTFVLENRQR